MNKPCKFYKSTKWECECLNHRSPNYGTYDATHRDKRSTSPILSEVCKTCKQYAPQN